jgi:hypothetical protein
VSVGDLNPFTDGFVLWGCLESEINLLERQDMCLENSLKI